MSIPPTREPGSANTTKCGLGKRPPQALYQCHPDVRDEQNDALLVPLGTFIICCVSRSDSAASIHMVDVGHKPETVRVAVARGEVRMRPETLALLRRGALPKGDVLAAAQLAGIMAAKRTSELIPLCHPLPLTQVDVQLALEDTPPHVEITARVQATAQTGVEMEALTAVCVAALTVYDMTKSAEPTMQIANVRLVEKRGGQSGDVINP